MASTSHLCGQPLKSRPGQTCKNRASHYVVGGQSCGKHVNFLVGKETSNYRTTPPPPPATPPATPFIPFDCGICMEGCRSANASCTTICNHKFHKTCLLKWERSGRTVFNCPMCRKELPRTTTTAPRRPAEQLELLMMSLRALNETESNAAVTHLENLINHAGIDAVATAAARAVREGTNRTAGSVVE